MLRKPDSCRGCALETKGLGWAPAVGPVEAGLLLVGEALGRQEAYKGEPFVGPAGEMLNRILRRVGIDRAGVRIDNLVRCQPPNDWLVGSPWEYPAVNRCRQYLGGTLQEPHRAVVAIGAAPTRHLLGLPSKKHKQENWHGCPTQDVEGRWVIPTFHPSFILRGNQKLVGTVAFDLQVALQVAHGKWARQEAELVVDPEADWFRAWVGEHRAALSVAPETTWLAVDIETSRKLGEDEGDLEDVAGDDIVRINFSNHPDLGVTVPWAGQYIDIIRDLLKLPGVKCFWNARFDVPRLRAAGCQLGGHQLDFMWAWHVLQSNLPRGLGFVAPFYSSYGAWKHLSGSDPGLYAAIDSIQTIRCAFGIARDLKLAGQWETFWRHVYQLDTRVLHPAEQIGLLVDQEELREFQKKLQAESQRLEAELQALVPEEIKPKKVWKREPDHSAGATRHLRRELVQACKSCGAVEIAKTHRCADREHVPRVELVEATVPRWIRVEPFNPASPDQLLDYILWKGLKGGKAKKSKTGKPSTDKKTLEALAKSSKDPFFRLVLDFRAVEKVRGTYVEGTIERLKGGDGRLHAQFLHVPSTMRLSCVRPNLQNVTTDRGLEKASIASGFRRCLVAEAGCRLIEVDYSGIEAVETGWFSGDPQYIRLAKLGVHAYLSSHDLKLQGKIKEAADLRWSDQDLDGFFQDLKKRFKPDYERAKRCVHGTNYGLTSIGMVNNFPEIFTRQSAEKLQRLYFNICPKLAAWQKDMQKLAAKQGYLGGQDHPFRYKHWFWLVYQWNARTKTWSLGDDAKRCVAYYPQSTAAGVVKEAALCLLDPGDPLYIGDLYWGRTPLRAVVHDSLLVEVPDKAVDRAIECLVGVMERPVRQQPMAPEWGMGEFLQIGAVPKVGQNWLKMEEIRPGTLASDSIREVEEEPEEAA